MHVLHLGFEHPQQPGAGGGSRRTHEIDRRLAAAGHRVTVLTTTFPGARDAELDGVRYVPVGPEIGVRRGGNRLTRLLGYVAGLPLAVRRHRGDADVVIEDFFAPFSSMAAPRWTGRPTVGLVQWLHARDKARQYRVPVHWVERAGVRSHDRLIAVSEGTAERLRAMNPDARVDVVGNGIEPALFAPPARVGRDVVFLGRLELQGKGLDLLLTAWAAVCGEVEGDLVIAGGGPEEPRVRRFAERLGVGERIRFVGWCSGADKVALLADARLVVVPSRHETFGLVALEALAAATPVLAFDIPCLREVIPDGVGWTVPAFDGDALAARLVDLLTGADALDTLAAAGARGREFARAFDWDALAQAELAVLTDVLAGSAARPADLPVPAPRGPAVSEPASIPAQRSRFGFSDRARRRFVRRYVLAKTVGLWRDVRSPRLRMFLYEVIYSLCRAAGRPILPTGWLRLDHVTTVFGEFHLRPGTIDAACVSPAFERDDLDHLLALTRERLLAGRRVVFCDVGADVGTYSVAVANRLRDAGDLRILAFEPASSSQRMVAANVEANGIGDLVELRPVALGDGSVTEAELQFDPTEPGGSGLDHALVEGSVHERVTVSTLDAELAATGADASDVLVLKIDVEGHEAAVLAGASAALAGAREVLLLVEDFVETSIIARLERDGWTFLDKRTPYNSFWVHRAARPAPAASAESTGSAVPATPVSAIPAAGGGTP
ncbi:FkbM family methyltransferase [Actinomycetospora sp. CA-101289]|uniref:FkbM family methyltransferase n=1 Tax=Actinomycetospora sp. CA-101289 TaxID=3239893 RepID=UPI003D97463B